MLRITSAAVLAAGMALLHAPIARADSEDFINYLAANGEDVSTAEMAFASIDLGQAYCGMLDASMSLPQTLDYLVNRPGAIQTPQSARMWLTGAATYLCPELAYLTR